MTTFQERFGPSWKAHLAQVAAEQEEARRLGINLAQWQGRNPAAPAQETNKDENDETD